MRSGAERGKSEGVGEGGAASPPPTTWGCSGGGGHCGPLVPLSLLPKKASLSGHAGVGMRASTVDAAGACTESRFCADGCSGRIPGVPSGALS